MIPLINVHVWEIVLESNVFHHTAANATDSKEKMDHRLSIKQVFLEPKTGLGWKGP